MFALAGLARVLHRYPHNLSSRHPDASPEGSTGSESRAEELSGEAMHDGLPDGLPSVSHDGLPASGETGLHAVSHDGLRDGLPAGGASSGWGESGWGGLAAVHRSLLPSGRPSGDRRGDASLLRHGLHAASTFSQVDASTYDASSTSVAEDQEERAGEERRAEAGEAYRRGIVVAADWAELQAAGEGAEVLLLCREREFFDDNHGSFNSLFQVALHLLS